MSAKKPAEFDALVVNSGTEKELYSVLCFV